MTGTDGQGNSINIQFSGAIDIDGKESAITGAPNNVAKVSAKRIKDSTTESVGRSADGKVIENVTVTIFADGKTLTRIAKIQGPSSR